MKERRNEKDLCDGVVIVWGGGGGLVCYWVVYGLGKGYRGGWLEGVSFMGSEYKVGVSSMEILGYVIGKFFGIKII